MAVQHTPTPWMLDGRPSYLVEQDDTTKKWCVVAHGKTICRLGTTDEDRANAAFIVRAANNFNELLATLKNARHWVEAANPSQNKDNALLHINWAISQAEGK